MVAGAVDGEDVGPRGESASAKVVDERRAQFALGHVEHNEVEDRHVAAFQDKRPLPWMSVFAPAVTEAAIAKEAA